MAYEVWNTVTGESHGAYETLDEAHGCVAYDRIKAYEIWRRAEATSGDRVVERCENVYHGDDQRVREALGQAAFGVPAERPRTVAREAADPLSLMVVQWRAVGGEADVMTADLAAEGDRAGVLGRVAAKEGLRHDEKARDMGQRPGDLLLTGTLRFAEGDEVAAADGRRFRIRFEEVR